MKTKVLRNFPNANEKRIIDYFSGQAPRHSAHIEVLTLGMPTKGIGQYRHVINALRRLVSTGVLKKVGRGTYARSRAFKALGKDAA